MSKENIRVGDILGFSGRQTGVLERQCVPRKIKNATRDVRLTSQVLSVRHIGVSGGQIDTSGRQIRSRDARSASRGVEIASQNADRHLGTSGAVRWASLDVGSASRDNTASPDPGFYVTEARILIILYQITQLR